MNCLTLCSLLIFLQPSPSFCQNFDPNMRDEDYLNSAQRKIKLQQVTARQELFDQIDHVRFATKEYIEATLRDNVFTVLRSVAEKELKAMSIKESQSRQPRQDDDDDDELPTPTPTIFPQIVTLISGVLGGQVNLTMFAESASKLLPRPIGTQLVNVVSLVDPSNRFKTTTTPAPQLRVPIVTIKIPPPEKTVANNNPQSAPTSPLSTANFSSADIAILKQLLAQRPKVDFYKNTTRVNRQEVTLSEKQHPLTPVLNEFQSLRNNSVEKLSNVSYNKINVTTESEDGFYDAYQQFDSLRKGDPHLFQGAREAFKFLEHVNGYFDTLKEAGIDEEN